MPIYILPEEPVFPPVGHAEDGLLAIGGDLSTERLMEGYRRGVFPWYNEGEPILWWSPDPRLILLPSEFRPPRSLRQTIRRGLYRVTHDEAFCEVITRCQGVNEARHGGTWITREMLEAYVRLHREGHAHSVEAWAVGGERDGQLVGGLYGVLSGRLFSGESMFTEAGDASKVALAWLVGACPGWGVEVIDCQVPTGHLKRLGAREVRRAEYLGMLGSLMDT